jgi:CRISPR/Cas system CSM-associated protein Csm3 (group 7 of RAMP superfamily)
MNRWEIGVEIELLGPILTRSTTGGDHGIDSVFFRDSQCRLAIPGTLVKGKIREAWDGLRGWNLAGIPDSQTLVKWFGEEAADAQKEGETRSNYDPQRGCVKFPEAFVFEDEKHAKLNIRIAIDDERGAADDGLLLVEERPFAPGEKAKFKGKLLFSGDNTEAESFRLAVKLGLNSLLGLGGNQGVGYGRLLSAEVKEPAAVSGSATAAQPAVDTPSWSLILRTEEPLCITEHRPAGNLFQSLEHIPGGVIKGALATQMHALRDNDKYSKLQENLDKIRIRHAFARPVGGPSPLARPLSLVATSKNMHDAVFCAQAQLVDGEEPRFCVNWKDADWRRLPDNVKRVELLRQTTVRTRIDREKRRAKDEALFAYESVLPFFFDEQTKENKPVEWATTIDFGQVPKEDRNAVQEQLAQLLKFGLYPVGKTEASFTVQIGGADAEAWDKQMEKMVAVTLVTPALIGDPAELTGKHSAAELHEYYRKAWESLLPGLKLSHYFAQQKLAGGVYLWNRFQKKQQPYQPWLLTTEGSVFVFEVTDPTAAARALETALTEGLKPYPKHTNWQNCPYVAENGYGEISIDVHKKLEVPCLTPQN